MTDFALQHCGSISLLHPRSEAGHAWIAENIPEDAQYFARAVVIEYRYVGDIVDGILSDDLSIDFSQFQSRH